jgi:arylsulfatase
MKSACYLIMKTIALILTLFLSSFVIPHSSFAATPRPNVVLLIADDLHYTALGCMGEEVRTPNIDKLAARSALFRNCIAQGTCCSPSRSVLLTGSYPHNMGVFHNQDGPMTESVWTFPAALRRAGYATALIGKNHLKPHSTYTGSPIRKPLADTIRELGAVGFEHAHPTVGKVIEVPRPFEQGTDVWFDYLRGKGLFETYLTEAPIFKSRHRARGIVTSPLAEEDGHDSYIGGQAAEWIGRQTKDKPFFLWVGFMEPHPPADPPEPYASMYDWKRMPVPLGLEPGHVTAKGPARGATIEDYQKFRAAYYGMITLMDKQVGRIVESLAARGLLDNTVIAFCSDHGSMNGDHDLWGKSVFYKGAVNSPLIVAGPGITPSARIDRTVELLDLTPTILELAQVPAADAARSRGESLLPLLTGTGTYARTTAFCEDRFGKMVVDDDYKFFVVADKPALFDLRADPDEMKNLAGTRPAVEQRMARLMADWLAATPPVLPANPVPARTDRVPKAVKKEAGK